MPEAQTIPGNAYGARGSRTGLLEKGFHLVLGLDLILESLSHGDDGIRRLENVRSCLPGVTVTFFTDLQARDAVELLSGASILLPDHLLAEAGMTISHRSTAGAMVVDPDYREWLDFQGDTRNQLGVAKAVGVEYLEICWHSPRPLMVVASPCPDSPILGLADIPVFTEGARTQVEIPLALTCRHFCLDLPGVSEVVKLMLAYLAGEPGDRFMGYTQPRKRSERSLRETLTEHANAWRIQPKRLGKRGAMAQEASMAAPRDKR